MSKKSDQEKIPKEMQPKCNEIVALTDEFCQQWLNAECAEMCSKVLAALARKRPSPLLKGNPNTWACAVVYAVGSINFLFDKSSQPHVKASELCEYFKLSVKTGEAKSKQIRDLLKIRRFDFHWTLPSRIDSTDMIWYLSISGFEKDIRQEPLYLQIAAYEKGLIPYVPALKEQNLEVEDK